jgi:membrane protein
MGMNEAVNDDEAQTLKPGLRGALRSAASQWGAHGDAKAGAAIAYYSVFSLGPLIVVAIAVAALAFGREGVQTEVTAALQELLGDKGTEAVATMLEGAGSTGEGLFAQAIGIVALLYAAVSLVMQLKDALNTVWDVEQTPGRGLWRFLRTYLISLAGVLSLGFLLLTSMLLTAALAAFSRRVGAVVPEEMLHAGEFVLSFLVISALFAMMFKWLPDADVPWRDVWLGAVGTAALFIVGKYVIGFYIGKQGLESKFGASAAIVIVLIWVYYSAQLVLFGAEFTRARNRQRTRNGRRPLRIRA